MPEEPGPNIPFCIVAAIGSAGAAFLATASAVENLVNYVFGPAMFWLITAPILALAWALEYFCVQKGGKDD